MGGLWTWKSWGEGASSSFGNPGGRGGQKTVPSVVGVWIFSGITQYRNKDQHRFENTWPLSSCITFDWQDFAEVLRLFKLTLLLNASPTFRGDIIPFRLISSISYAGLTAKTLYRKKNISENDREPLFIYLFSMMTHVWEQSNGPKLNYFQKVSFCNFK